MDKIESLSKSVDDHKTVHIPTTSLQSHEKFIERLKTFNLCKWFAKPKSYSPIQCAKYGWFNYSQNTLKCVSCGNLFYVYTPKNQKLNKTIDSEKCIDSSKLIQNHNCNCPWKIISVPDTLLGIELFDKIKAFNVFLKYKSSYDKCKHLPIIDESVHEKFQDVNYEQLTNSMEMKNYQSIYLSSVCGWSYIEDKNLLKCEKCLRSVGLWLFECMFYENENDITNEVQSILDKIINAIEFSNESFYYYEFPKSIDDKELNIMSNKRKLDVFLNDDVDDSNNKRIRKKFFNPIEEHYSWCPWKEIFNLNKNSCQLNSNIVYKHLINDQKNMSKKLINVTERIKSIQSLITNCASFHSLNND